jgi:DnaJ-class molecular chaperone
MKLWRKFTQYLTTCRTCHGLGFIEAQGGETKECPVCKGKGFI